MLLFSGSRRKEATSLILLCSSMARCTSSPVMAVMPCHLLWLEWATKDECRQNERFGDNIVALDIGSRVGFSVALGLRISKRFSIVATTCHGTQDIIGGAVKDSAQGMHICSCHAFANGADDRRTCHDS